MAIERKDEVLGKALESDTDIIPRYDITNPDGTKHSENVSLTLKNPVIAEGTPINKLCLDEMLAASGTTNGSSGAFEMAQEGFALFDGAMARCKLHTGSSAGATLNINGTGAKPILRMDGTATDFAIAAGVWSMFIYSATLDAWICIGWSTKSVLRTAIITSTQTWVVPTSVTSVNLQMFGGGGGAGGDAFSDNYSGKGGGGGAGFMKRATVTVTPGAQIVVTIGMGGTAGSDATGLGVTAQNGGTGGTTSFGALSSALGGEGGKGGSTAAYSQSGFGGNGGNGSSGGGGGSGIDDGGDGGNGADFGGGGGGRARSYGGGNGGNGGIYGGGGGAGAGRSTANAGGAGGTYGGSGGAGRVNGNPGTDTSSLSVDFPGTGLGGSAGTSESSGYGGGGGGGGYGGDGGNGSDGSYYSSSEVYAGAGGGAGGYGGNGGNGSTGGGGGGGYGGDGMIGGSKGGGGGGYGVLNYGSGGGGSRFTGNSGICIITYIEEVA